MVRAYPLLALSATAFYFGGCGVTMPLSWPSPEPTARELRAAPGHAYAFAPRVWDTPEGRIRVDVETAVVGPTVELAFEVRGLGRTLRCWTDDALPASSADTHARFECSSDGAGTNGLTPDGQQAPPVHFWLSPGHHCPLSGPGAAETYRNPVCWSGRARLGEHTVLLDHGTLTRFGAPVGYVAWTTPGGKLLLAANIVSEMRTALYDGQSGAPWRAELTLLTVALSWFEHATSGADRSLRAGGPAI